jgi:shikimate dehydrogenase
VLTNTEKKQNSAHLDPRPEFIPDLVWDQDDKEKKCIKDKNFIILGAGGAAKAIAFEAKKRGANVTVINRTPGKLDAIGFDEIDSIPDKYFEFVVNTIPVSIDILSKLVDAPVAMDASYASSFVIPDKQAQRGTDPGSRCSINNFIEELKARRPNATIIDGKTMFVNQAVLQGAFWL